MSNTVIRRLGDVTADLEILLSEMCFGHDLQHGEILSLVHIWLTIHAPAARETYIEGAHPEFYYGYPRKSHIKTQKK